MPENPARIQAIVVAGNGHILSHAEMALEQLAIPKASALLLLASNRRWRQQELRSVLKMDRWGLVVDLFEGLTKESANGDSHFGFWSRLGQIRRAIHRLRGMAEQWSKPDVLVTGVYAGEIDRTLCSLVKPLRVVLVDDGNMTVFTGIRRTREHRAGYRHVLRHNSHRDYSGFSGTIKSSILRKWAGVIDDGSERLTFFTAHRAIEHGPNDDVIPVTYNIRPKQKVAPGLVHFLGLPAIRRNVFTPESFHALIAQVREFYLGASEIVYFPHPAEADLERAIVGRAWPEAKQRLYETPYEEVIRQLRTLPQRVGSFYSSAISNVVAMDLGVVVDAFKAPSSAHLSRSRGEYVQALLERLKGSVNMIDLE